RFAETVGGKELFGVSRTAASASEIDMTWRSLGTEFVQSVLGYSNPWYVENIPSAPEFGQGSANRQRGSLALLPLGRGDQFKAVLVLVNDKERTFGAKDTQFLQAVSRQITLALENAWLYSGTIQVNEELRREVDQRKQAQKVLADFTAMVAHDLRSPLSNVV